MSTDREHPDPGAEPPADLPQLERQAQDAREKLADAERQAGEGIEQAEQLRERADELEEAGEELRRKAREPTGPQPPPTPGTTRRE